MSGSEIERLRALEKAATPGPWEEGRPVTCECGEITSTCWHTFERQAEVFPPLGEAGPVAVVGLQHEVNAAFIAAARNALPALLSALDEAAGLLEKAAELITAQSAAYEGQPAPVFAEGRWHDLLGLADSADAWRARLGLTKEKTDG